MCTLIPAGEKAPVTDLYTKHSSVCLLSPRFLITDFQDATIFKSLCIYQPIDLQFTSTSYIIYLLFRK